MRTARILRREIPPPMSGTRGYEKAREHLRLDFAQRCAYCGVHESHHGVENFEIDHFMPVSRGGGISDYVNLYWACAGCNSFKSNKWPSDILVQRGIRFIDPCDETEFPTHFAEDDGGVLIANTTAGGYHVDSIRLNRRARVHLRQSRTQLIIRYSQARSLLKAMRDDVKNSPEGRYIVEALEDVMR